MPDKMNMRPLSLELVKHCAKQEFCEFPNVPKCKCRIGCPIRKTFYNIPDDNDLEIEIQKTEIKLQLQYGESIAFIMTADLRNKMTTERKLHPNYFSYT